MHHAQCLTQMHIQHVHTCLQSMHTPVTAWMWYPATQSALLPGADEEHHGCNKEHCACEKYLARQM